MPTHPGRQPTVPRRRTMKIRVRRRKPSVAKATKANTRAIAKLRSQTMGWRQYQLNSQVGTIATQLHVERIMDIKDQWREIFQAKDNITMVRQFNLKSVRFNYAYQTESDTTGNLWFQMWVVSLKPKFSRQLRATTNDIFNLVADEHYSEVSMGTGGGFLQGYGNYQLNPAYFRIHHTTGFRRLGQTTMGGTESNVTNIRDSTHFGSCRIRWNKTLKTGDHRTNGIEDLENVDINDGTVLYTIILCNAGSGSELFRSHNYTYIGQSLNTN